MKDFVVYTNDATGKILRTGSCPDCDFDLQAGNGELVMEGIARDTVEKIVIVRGQPTVVAKTPAEIDRDNPKPPIIAPEDRMIRVKQKDWDALHARLDKLENP